MTFKTCPCCDEVKGADEFRPREDTEDGLTQLCDACLCKAEEKVYDREPPRDTGPGDYWVYKIYNADDDLLYIGRTKSGFRRIAQHKSRQHWSLEIATIRIEHFKTIAKADARERELIQEHRPPYNTIWVTPEIELVGSVGPDIPLQGSLRARHG